jgi:uncharacterized membrane protein
MKRNLAFSLVLACMCLLAPALYAQNYTVSGTVTWKAGKISLKSKGAEMEGKPVVGAKIRLGPGNLTATTDANGHYEIKNVTKGSYTMHIKAKEHSSVTKAIVVNDNDTYDVKLLWRNFRIGGKGNRNVQ